MADENHMPESSAPKSPTGDLSRAGFLRLAACMGVAVDLIEPMGFEWDDRRVRRTAMDYIDHVAIARHAGFDAFKTTLGPARLVLFTTKSRRSAYDFRFVADDVLLFGKESAGVPLWSSARPSPLTPTVCAMKRTLLSSTM